MPHLKKIVAALALVALALVVMVARPAWATPPILDAVASSSKAAAASAQLYTVSADTGSRLIGVGVTATTGTDTNTIVRLYNGTGVGGTLIYTVSLGQNGCRYDSTPRIQCPLGIYMEIVAGHADVVALVQTGTPY